MKQFLSAKDVTDVQALIDQAARCKKTPGAPISTTPGRRIGLLFFNPSLRTRLSMQLAARNIGLEPIVFDIAKDGWQLEFCDGAIMDGGKAEHISDAARVLGRYFDVLAVRSFPSLVDREEDYSEQMLTQLVRYCGVPVINMESATVHPLQSFADLLTITEHWQKPGRPKIVLSWAPHVKPLPQCVANSFAEWMNAWGQAEFVITHPRGYELHEKFSGGARIEYDQDNALRNADFVYVKSWSSYSDYGTLPQPVGNWMLSPGRMKVTNNAKLMHCLPVRRNVEIADALLDSDASLVTEQAANRIWAAQAVLTEILQTISDEQN